MSDEDDAREGTERGRIEREWKQLRDQIADTLDLAGAELQQQLRELAPKLAEVERRVEAGGEELLAATNTLFEDVGRALRSFGARMADKAPSSPPTAGEGADDEPRG